MRSFPFLALLLILAASVQAQGGEPLASAEGTPVTGLHPAETVAKVLELPPALSEAPPPALQEGVSSAPATARSAFVYPLTLADTPQPASYPSVLGGSTLGLVAGAAVGAGLGYVAYAISDPPDGDMFGGVFSVTAGAALGGAIGSWAGARWANERRGSPWATAAGAALGVAGGIGLGILVGDATESTALGVAMAVPIAIALPALAEVITSR
jgi:hypothetical protein